MNLEFWRVPTILGVMACSALTLFAAAVFVSIVIRRGTSRGTTAVLIAALGCLTIGGAAAIRATSLSIARALEVDVKYVDPGPAGYIAPLVFAAFLLVVGEWLLGRRWRDRRAALYCACVLAFTALNVVNYCPSGWCETIGFPFAWREWSDAMLVFEAPDIVQVLMESVGPAVAALVDLCVFVGVARVLTRKRRPGAHRTVRNVTD
jgi:hypothetical protein